MKSFLQPRPPRALSKQQQTRLGGSGKNILASPLTEMAERISWMLLGSVPETPKTFGSAGHAFIDAKSET